MSTSPFLAIPHCKLATGALMPLIGIGTWQSAPDEIDRALRTAIDVGYRLIDTAECYENEVDIGKTLRSLFDAGRLKREEIFITTKLWCTHNRRNEIESTLKESLRKLQLDYVDLYLVHMPVAYNHDMSEQDHNVSYLDTWKGMEDVFDSGLAKAIGVSNFNADQLKRIVESARIAPHNNQVELHLHFPQFELQKACTALNCTVTAYAPLGSPGRTAFRPPNNAKIEWPSAPNPFKNPIVIRLADKYGKTPAQILLRWLLEREIAIVPKSTNPDRIRENFNITDFSLSAAEVSELNCVQPHQRLFVHIFMAGHEDDPYKDER